MSEHPDTALLPFLRGELPAAEQARVAAHVETCAACARALAETGEVVTRLRGSLPEPPPIHWGAYRAQLRDRLRAHGAASSVRRWARPLPLAASAAMVALTLLMAWQAGIDIPGAGGDTPALEEVVIGDRLPLLQQYPVVERLDLLEDLEVIRNLDVLPVRGG